jgi:hypothetical protein
MVRESLKCKKNTFGGFFDMHMIRSPFIENAFNDVAL